MPRAEWWWAVVVPYWRLRTSSLITHWVERETCHPANMVKVNININESIRIVREEYLIVNINIFMMVILHIYV